MWVLVVLGAFGDHLKTALIWLCFSNFWCPHYIQSIFLPSSFPSLRRALRVASCHRDICGTRQICSWQSGRGKLWMIYVKIKGFFFPTIKSRECVESERGIYSHHPDLFIYLWKSSGSNNDYFEAECLKLGKGPVILTTVTQLITKNEREREAGRQHKKTSALQNRELRAVLWPSSCWFLKKCC